MTRVTARSAVKAARKKQAAKKAREKRKANRPQILISESGITWVLVEGPAREPLTPSLSVIVDTKTYCYRMTCECGRVRHAKPNDVAQVTRCRLCQAEARRAAKRKKNEIRSQEPY